MSIDSYITGDSEGWDGETIIELDNGMFFRQVEYFYHYQYCYRPKIFIDKNNNAKIAGIDKVIRVEPIEVMKSQLIGKSKGWDGKTILELTNGQVWKQAEYHYDYNYEFRPNVVIIISDSTAIIEGISKPVKVKRVR